MKKTDIHVLNWEKITKDANEVSPQTANKGIVFEDLIEKLLVAMFPKEVWRRTKESHDGKRDFVFPYEESLPDQKWAECKNYSSNLSLNIIAPTLIMGTIEKIESIFFFSYSPLNDSAIEGLLRYSETSNRNVKVFDGNVLESLICQYHNINGIAYFFPNTDFQVAYDTLLNERFRIIKMFKDINGNKLSASHLFEVGEIFYLHIILQNFSHERVNYEILVNTSKENLLKGDEGRQYYALDFSEIGEYSIQCHALKAGNFNCKIKITVQDIQKPFVTTKKIRVIDEPYLFWTGEHALSVLNQCEQHLTSYTNFPLLIAAESGMGKSTLISILSQANSILEKYKVLKINLDQTRNCCIKNLFSLLIGLHENEEIPKDQKEDDDKAFSFLMGNYAENAEMLAETIMKFYVPSHPYLFVVDDIQKIDRSYISLFRKLKEKSEDESKPIYFLFALNEEKYSVDALCSCLNWDMGEAKYQCKIIHLKKFRKKEIISFLKHKLGLEKIDKYFEDFTREIRPIEIHNFCASLKSERVIAPVPGSKVYQVIDFFKFEEKIRYIHNADISLKNICSALEKGDIPEYVLKYLYLTNRIKYPSGTIYDNIIDSLISFGILKESDGLIVFYHDTLREQVAEKFVFSEEDYADIYADKNTDEIGKCLCALHQIGRIRNSVSFLKEFFRSNYGIQKKSNRYEICWLIFENLSQITKYKLTADALYFVRTNYASLNAEHGHSAFLCFLKKIADSALMDNWDSDSESVENMAYYIKKFFDRSLSTYNYHDCSEYFAQIERKFFDITHISDSRRCFWLSHYANRAAIALDRCSVPLAEEPAEVSEMYLKSERYCSDSGSNIELLLQIAVDHFNRHYVYRHNLTFDIVVNTYDCLLEIKQRMVEESVLLEYHLLLLEYLQLKLGPPPKTEPNYFNLKEKIMCTREKCRSSFYIWKLYLLEIYILIDFKRFSDANILLNQVLEFAYKKEMRSYIYQLTYIKAHILIFQDNFMVSPESCKQIFLSFAQILEQRKNMPNDLMREIFLIVRLSRIMKEQNYSCIQMLPQGISDDIRNLMGEICKYLVGEHVDKQELFDMPSYFVFHGISFPNI